MRRIIRSPYFIAGIIMFLLVFFVMLLGVKSTVGEALFTAAALAAVGIGAMVWKEYF
jgi:hypothetical protein